MFWRTDYLKGAELITGYDVGCALFDILGPTERSPRGALFTKDHVIDSQPDVDINLPIMRMQNKLVQKCNTTAWWPWKSGVGDCDSRTVMAASDMIQQALKRGWAVGVGLVDLWYVSKTLADPKKNGRWNGYHSAPALLYKDHDRDLISFRIWQPPSKNVAGYWQLPEEEVKFWVHAVGMS